MSDKEKRSLGARILLSISSLALLCTFIYVLVAGVNLAAMLIATAALGGVAVPAVLATDGVLECVVGVIEAFFEGLVSIFEVIGEILGSIFS